VGATPDEHAVVFCGSGATHAIAKLIGVLGLKIPSALDDRYRFGDSIPPADRPVVFIGPYEHHSNELPWRESIADVVIIDEDADGHVSLEHLEHELVRHADRSTLIGSFSAASNVTGIITDTVAVSTLLHEHGALSLWDYAAAAPYVPIDMGSSAGRQPRLQGRGLHLAAQADRRARDAGGAGGAPRAVHQPRPRRARGRDGALREHERARLPPRDRAPRGSRDTGDHRVDPGRPRLPAEGGGGARRDRGPRVGVRAPGDRVVGGEPNIDVLGSHEAERLSIVSFVIRHGERHLHHNFVVAVLNDVFGIQSRGGCSCAGPYGHRLLGIDLDRSHEFQREITRGCEGIKPGWVRVNFNYFIDDATFLYIVDAIHLVASHGAALLGEYDFEPDSGLWHHRRGTRGPSMSLEEISYAGGSMAFVDRRHQEAIDLDRHLAAAHELFHAVSERLPSPASHPVTNADFEHLRWFPYADEFPGVHSR
jgi:hypothetical protein